MRLLLTRPELDAERTAIALRARGHLVVIAPLLHIEALRAPLDTGPWSAILVTSANAADGIAAHRSHKGLCALPVFAVGQRSAQAMRAAGFTSVMSADGDVSDLVGLVASSAKAGARMLYLAGADQTGDLAGKLFQHGLHVDTAVIYRAVAATTLPPVAADALASGIDGVLHFSRRSAETYVMAATSAGLLAEALRPVHYCLSAQVAEPLVQAGAAVVRVAPRPAGAALIELIASAPQ